MVSEKKQESIVFELDSEKAVGNPALGSCSGYPCYISKNSFPAHGKGWVKGVYYPREERVAIERNFSFSCRENCIVLASRIWKETEETGFGVYSYEDTEVIHVPLENGNYDISITFTNPAGRPYHAWVKANNITKIADVEIGKEDREVTFFSCIMKEELSLKILPVGLAGSREEAAMEEVYIRRISIRKRQEKMERNRPVIFLASDSTVQTYHSSDCPQTGWGQVFVQCFRGGTDRRQTWEEDGQTGRTAVYETEDIVIENRAIGGRSSRSFLDEGRLDGILYDVNPGDYVFVQFGHNDATAARPNRYVPEERFGEYLKYYIDGVRQRKATCVLVTPVARRNCEEEGGVFAISFPGYRKVMLDISKEQKVPLLDLGRETTAYLNKIGPEESKKLFLWTAPGEFPDGKYAGGVVDNTHLQRRGAEIFAGIAARLIKEYDMDNQLDKIKGFLK